MTRGVRLSRRPDNRHKDHLFHCCVLMKVAEYLAEFLGTFESECRYEWPKCLTRMSRSPDSEKVPILIWWIFVGPTNIPQKFQESSLCVHSNSCQGNIGKVIFEVHESNYRYVILVNI
jgi:hypothetical protein